MPVNRFAPLELVNPEDPRLDPQAMDTDAYAKSYDPAMIRDKDPERKAPRFVFRPMTRRFFTREMSGQSYGKQVETAILAGIVRVEVDGEVLEPTGKPTISYGQSQADPEWFEKLAARFGEPAIANVANGVVLLSKLPDSDRPTSSSPAA